MKYDAVIFDMDGLLLDTERVAFEAFVEACESLKVRVDRTVYMQRVGTTAAKTREILVNALGKSFPYDALERVWSEKYARGSSAKAVPLKDGAEALLERVRKARLPMALATSTAHEEAVVRLESVGLLDFFELIVAGDQVHQGKPDAETYLKAAEGLGLSANRCLAIEDSDNGVRSAHVAGMAVIQVPDLVEPADEVRLLGHIILGSLGDVERYLESEQFTSA